MKGLKSKRTLQSSTVHRQVTIQVTTRQPCTAPGVISILPCPAITPSEHLVRRRCPQGLVIEIVDREDPEPADEKLSQCGRHGRPLVEPSGALVGTSLNTISEQHYWRLMAVQPALVLNFFGQSFRNGVGRLHAQQPEKAEYR